MNTTLRPVTVTGAGMKWELQCETCPHGGIAVCDAGIITNMQGAVSLKCCKHNRSTVEVEGKPFVHCDVQEQPDPRDAELARLREELSDAHQKNENLRVQVIDLQLCRDNVYMTINRAIMRGGCTPAEHINIRRFCEDAGATTTMLRDEEKERYE